MTRLLIVLLLAVSVFAQAPPETSKQVLPQFTLPAGWSMHCIDAHATDAEHGIIQPNYDEPECWPRNITQEAQAPSTPSTNPIPKLEVARCPDNSTCTGPSSRYACPKGYTFAPRVDNLANAELYSTPVGDCLPATVSQAPEQGIVWTPVEGSDGGTTIYRIVPKPSTNSQAPFTPTTTYTIENIKPTWVPDPSAGHYDCLEPGYVAYIRSEPVAPSERVKVFAPRTIDAKGHVMENRPPPPICVKEKP